MEVSQLIIFKDTDGGYSFLMIERDAQARVDGIYHKPENDILENFYSELENIAIEQNTRETPSIEIRRFKILGELIYRHFLPGKVKNWLNRAQHGLAIITNEPNVPWELMNDGEQFIGLKRAIGRSLIMSDSSGNVNLNQNTPETRQNGKLKILMIVDPTGDLTAARSEASSLSEWFKSQMTDSIEPPVMLQRQNASVVNVCQELTQRYDIILYAGHIVNRDGQSSLRLANDKLLSATVIRDSLKGDPIVLLMGCRSAANANANDSSPISKHMRNVAEAFISAGAKSVVGTLWEISDSGAREFDEALFEKLIRNKKAIGEAIRLAREEILNKRPTDATWSSVVLYGDPSLTLLPPALPPVELQSIVNAAVEEARLIGSDVVTEDHLFLALVNGKKGILRNLLIKIGVQNVDQCLEKFRSPKATDAPDIFPPCNDVVKSIIDLAYINATAAGHSVEEEDLVTAFIKRGGGVVAERLDEDGINLRDALEVSARSAASMNDKEIYDARTRTGLLKSECFTPDAWKALTRAARFTEEIGHQVIGTPHLLVGLMELTNGLTQEMMEQQGITLNDVMEEIHNHLESNAMKTKVELAYLYLSPNLRKILSIAVETLHAEDDMTDLIGEKHLLVGLVMVGGVAGGILALALNRHVEESAHEAIAQKEAAKRARDKKADAFIDKYGRDLTLLANDKKLPPVCGRSEPIGRMIEILGRRETRNLLLTGKDGVGKTALVEGLAQMIVSGEIPDSLKAARIVEINVSSLVSDAPNRADFEKRMESLLQVSRQAGLIVFIDDLHALLKSEGDEKNPIGPIDLLRPLLDQEERCFIFAAISSEPFSEWSRCFEEIHLGELAPSDTLMALRNRKADFESSHGVTIDDAALETVVRLTESCMPDRSFPEKALDALSEACEGARASDEGERKVSTKEVEHAVSKIIGRDVHDSESPSQNIE